MSEKFEPLRVLIVEDSADDTELIVRALQQAGYAPDWAHVQNEKDYCAQLETPFDIILCDYALPQFDALRALDILQARDLDIPFIIVSGTIGEDSAVLVMKKGATDYLLKDRLTRLGTAVAGALEQKQLRLERQQRDRELAAITNVSAALRTAQTCAEMLPIILDQLMELFQAEGARIDLCDSASGKIKIELGGGRWHQMTGLELRRGEGVSGYVIDTRQPYVINNMADEPRLALPHLLNTVPHAVCVPLIAHEEVIGTLWLGQATKIKVTEIRLTTAVADIAANAIHRANLHEKTEAQARQLQCVMDTVADGLILLKEDYCVALTNPAAEAHLDLLANSCHEEIRVGKRLTCLGGQPIEKLLSPPPDDKSYHELVIQEPEHHIFEVITQPMMPGLHSQGWVLALRDVTEERQMQERNQRQERLAAVGQLAAGIAHDFNNILAVIVLYAQMVQRAPHLSPKDRRRLDIIYQQAGHATNLVHQILDFSRRSVMNLTAVDLLPFLQEMEQLWLRTLPENIIIELDFNEESYIINADPTRLQQGLMNLVVNARDAMPQGGVLRLGLRQQTVKIGDMLPIPHMLPGQWLSLSVSDNGSGITPESLLYLFEPFYTTKEPGKGTGLGLAQVYGIVRQHNGYITVDSQVAAKEGEPSGTTFTIYLPLLKSASYLVETAQTVSPLVAVEATILLVEDDSATREAMQDVLLSIGYQVITAANGRTAIDIFNERGEEIDIVLSDMVMPGVSGVALYETLKELRPSLKMIIVTGYPLEDKGKALLEKGIVDWLHKPFSAEEIAEKVQAALNSGDTVASRPPLLQGSLPQGPLLQGDALASKEPVASRVSS